MRLADFILQNTEPILGEWESFARSIWPNIGGDPAELRDHALDILHTTVADMNTDQTSAQQSSKSKGVDGGGEESRRLDHASEQHGVGRVESGFKLMEVMAEYRALRASVIRLWRESKPDPDRRDLDDLTRFNESIDQSLTMAAASYTDRIDQSRQLFLAILGHDLRNPLNAMMMAAQAMRIGGLSDAAISETAATMAHSAKAMARMINDLLDFTGTGLGSRMPLSPSPMNLAELCHEVAAEIRAAHPDCSVHCAIDNSRDLTGEWDPARLRQLVSNLLGNAVQHGDSSCRVKISLESGGSEVVLSVYNSGPPIPHEALATLFDPLVRLASPHLQRPRRPGSIGLGLYIARQVVLAHGGAIDVTSSQQEGTVFTVRLPRRAET